MSERNWPLLIRVGMQIVEHPETWNQRDWVNSCGTRFCFAGHAITLAGHNFARDEDGAVLNYVPAAGFPELEEEAWPSSRAHADVLLPATVAQRLLGLEYTEGEHLFYAANRLSDLLGYLNQWARADGVSLPEPLKLTAYRLAAWERAYIPSRDD